MTGSAKEKDPRKAGEILDEAGKFHLNDTGLITYSHGEYFLLGKKLGTFGYSVKKEKKRSR